MGIQFISHFVIQTPLFTSFSSFLVWQYHLRDESIIFMLCSKKVFSLFYIILKISFYNHFKILSCLQWMLKMFHAKNMQYTCKLNLLKCFSNCFKCLCTSKVINIYFLVSQSFFVAGTSLFFSLDTVKECEDPVVPAIYEGTAHSGHTFCHCTLPKRF